MGEGSLYRLRASSRSFHCLRHTATTTLPATLVVPSINLDAPLLAFSERERKRQSSVVLPILCLCLPCLRALRGTKRLIETVLCFYTFIPTTTVCFWFGCLLCQSHTVHCLSLVPVWSHYRCQAMLLAVCAVPTIPMLTDSALSLHTECPLDAHPSPITDLAKACTRARSMPLSSHQIRPLLCVAIAPNSYYAWNITRYSPMPLLDHPVFTD